jgi:hypothetical protein
MRISALFGVILVITGCNVGVPPTPTSPPPTNPGSAPTRPPAAPTPTSPPAGTSATAPARSAPTPTSAPTSAPTTVPTSGSLIGRVTQTGGAGEVPSVNTLVELRPEAPIDPSDPPQSATHTDRDGHYAMDKIAFGRYLISAGGGGAGSPESLVTIAALAQTVDMRLESAFLALTLVQLTGSVVDDAGRPKAAASVWESGGDCHAITATDGTYKFVVRQDTEGPRRILTATTSDRSGFILATDKSPQPVIRLTRPTQSGVPSGVCQMSLPAFPSPSPAAIPGLRMRIVPSTLPRPNP